MLPCCASKSSDEMFMLYDIANKPHEVFTNDLIFVLSKGTSIKWMPPCYNIHSCSPLTIDLRTVFSRYYRSNCGHFRRAIETDVARNFSKLRIYEKFSETLRSFLGELLSSDISGARALTLIGNSAIMGIEFHEYGYHDAITFAAIRISGTLKECIRRHNFRMFDLISEEATDIVNCWEAEKNGVLAYYI